MLNYNYIEEIATRTLKENKLYKPGFDVEKLAKKLDVTVIADVLVDEVAGFFVMKNNKPVITYNTNANEQRQRFTIAHELGHFILHSKQQPIFIDKSPKVYYRNSESSTGEILKEREANAYAAALLMPRELIKEELNSSSAEDLDELINALAKRFKVSTQAMSFRLSNLGYDIG